LEITTSYINLYMTFGHLFRHKR